MSTAAVEIPRPELVERNWFSTNVKHRFAGDVAEGVKKLTSAAAKLRIHRRKKQEKKQQKQQLQLQQQQENEKKEEAARQNNSSAVTTTDPLQSTRAVHPAPPPALPQRRTAPLPAVPERKWTLSDLLHSLGVYVQKHCTHLGTIPSSTDVAMWVRCADRALQLNGWTINCFLLESHVVFTYMLLVRAFEQFRIQSVADVKELVMMCLYISYTYNANEISYPLRPFLVKHDRVTFWDKCTTLSLSASRSMLKINQDHVYYAHVLASLKSVTVE